MEISENKAGIDKGPIGENKGEIVVYQPDEITRLEVRVNNETVWLTQAQMSDLFGRDQSVIARHIKNIFEEKELDDESNMQILHNTISRFKPVAIYSLDVIISVGYRVKSIRGTQFRQWANRVLKEYLIKGYSISAQLSQLSTYFNERLESHNRILVAHESQLKEHAEKIEFFIQSSLPPKQGIFFDGQIYDAYAFVAEDLLGRM